MERFTLTGRWWAGLAVLFSLGCTTLGHAAAQTVEKALETTLKKTAPEETTPEKTLETTTDAVADVFPSAALNEVMYLAQVKTRLPDSDWLANRLADDQLHTPLEVVLAGVPSTALAKALAQTNVIVGDETAQGLSVRVPVAGTLTAPLAPWHSQPSWVVDFDQPAVAELVRLRRAAERDEAGSAGWIDSLTTFTHSQIERPSYRNGFFIASQVARGKEGDCTEFAVLNAALARGQGLEARVVFGLLLLTTDRGVHAWGHAWNEVYDGKVWVLSDATLPRADPAVRSVHYLPIKALEDEGPGHLMQLLEFATLRPSEVIVVDDSVAAPSVP